MNVLVVHNRYQEAGGEDRVVELESALLARNGHTVVHYSHDNRDVDGMNRVALAGRTLWNHTSYREVRRLIVAARADVLHVHNTLPLASPAVYYAAHAEGIPVVQTLHNYRLVCPNALCFRAGKPCTACVGAPAASASVRHACYRGSRAATTTIAAMLWVHRTAGTWHSKVDTFVAPTEFARRLFVSGGLPAGRIVVKPHFVDVNPAIGSGARGNALFVGRLSEEKGVPALLAAWERLDRRIPLTIVGDGPLAPLVADAARRLHGITWLGRQERAEVQRLIGEAAFLVFPSAAYETFGQVVIEAYAAGTPVLASAGGAAAELIDHGRTGLLMRPSGPDGIVAQVEWFLEHAASHQPMRTAARAAYEARFTADANYQSLLSIYRNVTARAAARRDIAHRPDHGLIPREEIGQ